MQQASRVSADGLGSAAISTVNPAIEPARPADPPLSFADKLAGVRDRLVASAWFQRWAAACPLTRPVAQRHAQYAFDLCAGFVYSQVLYACVRLRVFDVLAERPLTQNELARRLDLSPEATARLVQAATSLGLLAPRSAGRIGLGLHGAALRGNPGALVMIEHHALLYADLADPLALLRGQHGESALSRYWPYASHNDVTRLKTEETTPYTQLMSRSQSLIADDILAAYDFSHHTCLLDVGGGDGTFLAHVTSRHAKLRALLFDVPAVAAAANARFAMDGLSDRVEAIGGDFRAMALPRGADVISLVRVVLDHDDDTARALLAAVRNALPPGGTLVIAEPIAGQRGAHTVGDVYFNFYLFAMGRGRARSLAEMTALLTTCGFTAPHAIRTRRPILTGLLTAQRID